MPARVLLTGAGGFAGHHALEHILTSTDWEVVATDSFRHRGKTDRIAEVLAPHPEWRARLRVLTHDLSAPFTDQMIYHMGKIDYVIAMASESHVDRSIEDPVTFIRNNVNLALSTLEFARIARPKSLILISTDEVYGPLLPTGDVWVPHAEWSPILPSNPYSASKAAQEAIAISYWRTYNVPVVIVNCMNLIGERQDPEKYMIKLIRGISRGERVTVHGTRGNIGSRRYLHARNLADALLFIFRQLPPSTFPANATTEEKTANFRRMQKGRRELLSERPDRYNVVPPDIRDNLQLAREIAAIMGKPLHYQLVDFHSARPGHDPHYGLDHAKLEGLGWKPPVPFEESLVRTVKWTLAHPEWLL